MSIDFGKHAGKDWSEIPVEYLRWLLRNSKNPVIKFNAKEQIKERTGNSAKQSITITNHAIDRASQRLLDIWMQEDKGKRKGLYTWLKFRALQALKEKNPPENRNNIKISCRGIGFVFSTEGNWPVLVTVYKKNRISNEDHYSNWANSPH